jgi:Flp pilus assembly pilin Flp
MHKLPMLRDTRGASLVEYILVVGLVALVAAAGFRAFGSGLSSKAQQQAGCIKSLDSNCGSSAQTSAKFAAALPAAVGESSAPGRSVTAVSALPGASTTLALVGEDGGGKPWWQRAWNSTTSHVSSWWHSGTSTVSGWWHSGTSTVSSWWHSFTHWVGTQWDHATGHPSEPTQGRHPPSNRTDAGKRTDTTKRTDADTTQRELERAREVAPRLSQEPDFKAAAVKDDHVNANDATQLVRAFDASANAYYTGNTDWLQKHPNLAAWWEENAKNIH